MKRILLIFLLLAVITGVGYYFYQKEFKEKAKIEEVVPSDAFLFYNSNTPLEDLELLQKADVKAFISGFESFNNFESELNNVLQLVPKNDIAIKFSLHKTSKNNFDLIYYFDSNKSNIEGLIDIIAKKNKWIIEERNLDQILITEYTSKGKTTLNYCNKNGWLIISKSSFLIEETIKNKHKWELFNVEKPFTLFPVNYKSFLSVYFQKDNIPKWVDLGANPISFDLTYDDKEIIFSGESSAIVDQLTENGEKSFLQLVPMNTAVYSYNNKGVTLNLADNTLIKLKDVSIAIEANDSIYTENYVYLVKGNENGISYINSDNIEINAPSKGVMRNILEDIENDNVWGKSIKMKNKFDLTVKGADEGVFSNFSKYSKLVFDLLNDEGRTEYGRNLKNFNLFDFISFQKTITADRNIFEGFITFKNSDNVVANDEEVMLLNEELVYQHNTKIVSKPFIVKNHTTGGRELIFQDSINNVCLISSNRELLWMVKLDSVLNSDIYQIDMFRNGKLQFMFTSGNQLFLVDRNGGNVEGFPIHLDGIVKGLSIFDYNNNKKYRFLITMINGDLILVDPTGKQLKPWDPIKLNSPCVQLPEHASINNKDVIVTVSNDSKIHCLNRRGEYYKGFPLSVGLQEINGFYVNKKTNFGNSIIELFSKSGQSVTINFNGELISKNEYKGKVKGDFTFIMDGSNFVYTIDSEYTTSAYTLKNQLIFEEYDTHSELQYYSLSSDKDLVLANDGSLSKMYSNNKLIGEFNATDQVDCIYSSAKEELLIYKVNGSRLEKIKMDY